MHASLGFLIACLAVVSHGLPKNYIVGGTDAEIGGYPYMASLKLDNRHFCGGSIISERYILTAAHCLMKFLDPKTLQHVTVHVGTNFLNETGYVYKPEKSIMHHNFDLIFIHNDIGLLRLNRDIEYNKLVQPISFAKGNLVKDDDPCLLTGWGTQVRSNELRFRGEVPNKLQKVDLKVYSQDKCKRSFWNVQDDHICAFSQYGQGACHGDSGSPLVSNGVQIGIASFVRPCAVGHPDVYTRVSTFNDWITERHRTHHIME